jgi:glycosyltransferase involved in cell wall biosynthesis
MSHVLFVDWTCPSPYSARTVREAALGGTEATATRIAEALDARVMQHNRTEADGRYVPPFRDPEVQHVVVLRDPRCMREMHERFPGARLYLWMHDLVRPGSKRGRRIAAAARVLSELDVQVVCVSNFQRSGMEATLREAGFPNVPVRTIYNPIDDTLQPDGSIFDSNKLVFFSSPNKGLAFTLDAFQALRRRMPEMRLHVGNPGYKKLPRSRGEGVTWLGGLPHARILAEVRTALCVFYPNFVLPETFGLVLAEANAVGTPVITHDRGAASEVLNDARQVLPVTDAQRLHDRIARMIPSPARPLLQRWSERRGAFAPYIEHVAAWRNGARPQTGPDARFKLSAIASEWRALFAEGANHFAPLRPRGALGSSDSSSSSGSAASSSGSGASSLSSVAAASSSPSVSTSRSASSSSRSISSRSDSAASDSSSAPSAFSPRLRPDLGR